MNQAVSAKLKVTFSMLLFGTIGVFVRYISLPSSLIALARGIIGMLFLLAVTLFRRSAINWKAVRKNLLWLLLSGVCLGFNWILLFESYQYTSVAVSTLCYYMAPILIILASPLVLREKLTGKKILCVVIALCGMICISGILESGIPSAAELKGILLGLAAAVLYACIVMLNKQAHGLSAYDKTILQLGISSVTLLPYCALTVPFAALHITVPVVGLLILVGILHTGLTYFLYFGSIEHISAQTVAIISYVDPVVAVLASVLILREPIAPIEWLGAALILGAALASEISLPAKKKENAA